MKEENRLKLYCPLRIDQGIFVLKFSVTYYVSPASLSIQPKYITSTFDSRTEMTVIQPVSPRQPTTQDDIVPKKALRTIDSSNKKPPSRLFIKKVALSSDSENQVLGTTAASTLKRNPFKFSQESGFKSVRKNGHAVTSSLRASIPQGSGLFASESFQSKSANKAYAFKLQEDEKENNKDAMEIETENSIKFETGTNGKPKCVRIRDSEISLKNVTVRRPYRNGTPIQTDRKLSLQYLRQEASGIFNWKRKSLFKILEEGGNGIKRMLFGPGETETLNKEFSEKMNSALRNMKL